MASPPPYTPNRIAFRSETWAELVAALEADEEVAAILFAGVASMADMTVLLVREIRWIAAEHIAARSADGLSIRSAGYVPALKDAGRDASVAIFFHTHPGGAGVPSDADAAVDRSIRAVFVERTGGGFYASMVLGGTANSPEFSGTLYYGVDGPDEAIDVVRVIGRTIRVLASARSVSATAPQMFDRQIRAFGVEGQSVLQRMRIGVVGVGGTGSAVCEQLLRLGVRDLLVVDDDQVDESNLTRIHQSTRADVGRPKVSLVAGLAEGLGHTGAVRGIEGNVTSRRIAEELRGCDVVFGCTDDEAGRAVLSRIAYWYLIPLLDVGVLIESQRGAVRGLFARVTTVLPGEACLICRRRVDPIGIRNQLMGAEERQRLAGEGYAPELAVPAPSVVAYTTLVASLAMNEFLDRVFRYGGDDVPSEIVARLHERDIRSNRVVGVEGHYCTTTGNWGRGDGESFLGQMWAS